MTEKLTRSSYTDCDSIRKSPFSCLSSRASVSPWRSYCRSQSALPITRSFHGCRKWSPLIATLRCSPADTTSLWKQAPRDAPGNKYMPRLLVPSIYYNLNLLRDLRVPSTERCYANCLTFQNTINFRNLHRNLLWNVHITYIFNIFRTAPILCKLSGCVCGRPTQHVYYIF